VLIVRQSFFTIILLRVVARILSLTAGPILSVFPALIVHSELKSAHPDFQLHLFFKHKLINK